MKEANQDAAQQIFEKVNASKLPINLLDLHGLHVDEALGHLSRVLREKTTGKSSSLYVNRSNKHGNKRHSMRLKLTAVAQLWSGGRVKSRAWPLKHLAFHSCPLVQRLFCVGKPKQILIRIG